jgi:hypothetical protein
VTAGTAASTRGRRPFQDQDEDARRSKPRLFFVDGGIGAEAPLFSIGRRAAAAVRALSREARREQLSSWTQSP